MVLDAVIPTHLEGDAAVTNDTTARTGEDHDDRPLTVKQAADMLGINEKTAYEMIKRKELPAIKAGRLRLIPRRAFLRILHDGGVAA
jgi:excisionase family DNA binding protein